MSSPAASAGPVMARRRSRLGHRPDYEQAFLKCADKLRIGGQLFKIITADPNHYQCRCRIVGTGGIGGRCAQGCNECFPLGFSGRTASKGKNLLELIDNQDQPGTIVGIQPTRMGRDCLLDCDVCLARVIGEFIED